MSSLVCNGTLTNTFKSGTYTGECSVPFLLEEPLAVLTYAESGQLIGATALLFSVAFIIRVVLRYLGH